MICQKLKALELSSKVNLILQEAEKLKERFLETGDEEVFKELKKKARELSNEFAKMEQEFFRLIYSLLPEFEREIKEWARRNGGGIIGSLVFSDGLLIWKGNIYFGKTISFFPESITAVKGDLFLNNSSIRDLPFLKSVEGSLILENARRLVSLPSLEKVGEALNILGTPILDLNQALPRLRYAKILYISIYLKTQAKEWKREGKIDDYKVIVLP